MKKSASTVFLFLRGTNSWYTPTVGLLDHLGWKVDTIKKYIKKQQRFIRPHGVTPGSLIKTRKGRNDDALQP